jgi:hypothetical protein
LRPSSNSAWVIAGAFGLVLWYIGSLPSGDAPAWYFSSGSVMPFLSCALLHSGAAASSMAATIGIGEKRFMVARFL